MATIKHKDGISEMNRSTAHTEAVYRGVPVSTFNQDLSNYSQLRRGLSKEMRARTMTKTELKQVTPETARQYIDILNQWRTDSQLAKAQRGNKKAFKDPTAQIFAEALKTGYFNGDAEAKAKLMTAGLKISRMDKDTARKEVTEALNAKDRTRSQDFYKADYYLDQGNFDPLQATDNMLREIVVSGYIDKYPDKADVSKEEYRRRISGTGEADNIGETELSNQRARFMEDLVSIADLIIK